MSEPPGTDHADARMIADAAGRLLMGLRASMGFDDAEALRAEGDRRSHGLIVSGLAARHPGDTVVSEEAPRTARPGAAGRRHARVWVVDPLDGTREFGEAGRTDFAVHVALVVDGRPVAGAVALPARGLTLGTDDPPPVGAPGERRRCLVSRSRPPALTRALAAKLGVELIEMGSAGAKAMAVVLGEADMYVHAGGQYEWDSAAPVAVARSSGLHASRLDGTELVYDQEDPWLPDLLVCRPEIAAAVLDAVSELGFEQARERD